MSRITDYGHTKARSLILCGRIKSQTQIKIWNLNLKAKFVVQVNLCQKLLFLHQLTHNMTTDCALNYKFNAWKFQAQTWREHVVYRYCFWHPEQILYTTNTEIPAIWNPSYLLTLFYRTPFNNNVQTRNPKISNGPNIRFPNRDAVIPAVRRRRIDWLCSTGHHSMTIYGSSSLLWWPRALLWRAFFVIPHTPPILKP